MSRNSGFDSNLRLPFDDPDSSLACPGGSRRDRRIDARDRASRERAVDPRFNVALEASAGTGKTRMLVDRYINLLREGIDPSNILAITFTRKAAAEMRERIVTTLRAAAGRGEFTPARWRELRDRVGDIAISTIDAFCLSLLREFPLEADVDPGFSMADETEVPRLLDESLDRTLRICRGLAREDENVALAFAQLTERRVRAGLAALLNRRIVAPSALRRYLAKGPRDLTVASACEQAARGLHRMFASVPGGLDRFLEEGPLVPAFTLLARDIGRLEAGNADPAFVQLAFARVRDHFLTQEGQPRKQLPYSRKDFATEREWRHHRDVVVELGPRVVEAFAGYRRDLNVIVSRGIWRMFNVALAEYERTLSAHAVLDFPNVLLKALELLRQMDEFAQSRYRLESRYHHILVDEFQDTSRAQWELVSLLVKSWGEGFGLAHAGPLQPTIFIVGDRKQSIYGFRDADVSVLDEASRYLEGLREGSGVRRAISRSYRSVPGLLSFVNDVFEEMEKAPARRDAFGYGERDRFPIDEAPSAADVLGLLAADTPEACAEQAAAEIARLLAETDVHDRDTGLMRRARPADVAILFRTRESHREFEEALERRGIPTYVYKGLGFFDADEIKDALSLLWYLADPLSNLRAAAFLRSRFVRLSDEGLRILAPNLADALQSLQPPVVVTRLDSDDARALEAARASTHRWRGLVDRLPPAELVDAILSESAYTYELRGARLQQARENLKKIRALIRRIQNRGYATLGRIAAHLDRLSAGDESNAVIDALDAVSLMTVHASKGLEFPVVFLVNLAKGTGNRRDPVRVIAEAGEDGDVSVGIGDFQSEADDDAVAKEREETKRLLYVALTRARDRLYLGSVLKEGRLQPGRGSLAEVLPASVAALFAEASTTRSATWRAASGASHVFRICNGVGVGAAEAARYVRSAELQLGPFRPHYPIDDDFGPLADAAPAPRAIGDVVRAEGIAAGEIGGVSDRLIGTVVHRLVERFGLDGTDPSTLAAAVPDVLRTEESIDAAGVEGLGPRAADAYRTMCAHPRVREICASGDPVFEVPFTMQTADGILRGSIDCLVRRGDGTVVVLEFKTGRPRPEHRAQLDLYRQAAAALFPASDVEGLLVYADEAIA